MTFGDWLNRQLVDNDLSMSKFAQMCGVSHVAVSRWISGQRIPEPESCEGIAKALGIPVEIVYREAGHPVSPTDLDHNTEIMLGLFRNLPADEQQRVLAIMRAFTTMHEIRDENDSTKGE